MQLYAEQRFVALLIYLHFALIIKADGSKMINQGCGLKNVFIPKLTNPK